MKQALIESLDSYFEDEEEANESEPEIVDDEEEQEASSEEGETVTTNMAMVRLNMAVTGIESKCFCRFGEQCQRIALDNGCTRHISNLPVDKATYGKEVTIIDAVGRKSSANISGALHFKTTSKTVNIPQVLHCKAITGTLLSVKQLIDDGYNIDFQNQRAIVNKGSHHLEFPWSNKDGLYILYCTLKNGTRQIHCKASIQPQNVTTDQLMHYRFGHFGNGYIRRAGLKVGSQFKHFCPGCATEKATQAPTKKSIDETRTTTYVPQHRYEVLCMDTFGPIQQSKLGNKFFVTHLSIFRVS